MRKESEIHFRIETLLSGPFFKAVIHLFLIHILFFLSFEVSASNQKNNGTGPSSATEKLNSSISTASKSQVPPTQKSTSSIVEKNSSPWGFSSTLKTQTDMMTSSDKRRTNNSFQMEAGYSLQSDLSLSAGTDLSWTADGSNVRKTEDNPRWNDLEIGIQKSVKINPTFSLIMGVSDALPTGYESRTEAVKNTLSGSLTVSANLLAEFSVTSTLQHSVIWQTYDYSVTSGESNVDGMTVAILGAHLKFFKNFKISGIYQIWNAHTINNENTLARNQSLLKVSYGFWQLKTFLQYSFGNYDKNDSLKGFYFDENRQSIAAGVSFEI